jgi:hypothetical protein
MLWYRAFGLGLLGACCVLLAMRPPATIVTCQPGHIRVILPLFTRQAPVGGRPLAVDQGPTIIDVARGVSASQIARLLVVAPGERIVSIDDGPVAGDIDAGLALAASHRRIAGAVDSQRRFIDVAVVGELGPRRVLLLLH